MAQQPAQTAPMSDICVTLLDLPATPDQHKYYQTALGPDPSR